MTVYRNYRLAVLSGYKSVWILTLWFLTTVMYYIFSADTTFSKTGARYVQNLLSSHGTFGNGTIEAGPDTNETLLELDDIYIAVTTAKKFHDSRVKWQLLTWMEATKNQTYIYTDGEDDKLQKELPDGNVINTNCGTEHDVNGLCCKTAMQFDNFTTSNKKWLCHVDDDNYINVPRLLWKLRQYDHTRNWYLGRPAWTHPIRAKKTMFWYATGGAGYCVSKHLAKEMLVLKGPMGLLKVCTQVGMTDDLAVGFVINHLLKQNFTIVPEFHSHRNLMRDIYEADMKNQITFSYKGNNKVDIQGFSPTDDPTRFLSIHCKLHPGSNQCWNMPKEKIRSFNN